MTVSADMICPPQAGAACAGPITVAFYSPGWPPGLVPNGIASYVGTIVGALEQLGDDVRPWVVTPSLKDPGTTGERVHVLPPQRPSLVARAMNRLRPRPASLAPNPRQRARQLSAAVDQLVREQGLDLFEVEESFGWVHLMAPRHCVPVVVRLHGPWFLNGAALGYKQDPPFRRRDALERLGLLAADAVTAPSAQVLRATREHFGLELPRAEVIHNPVPPCPPEQRWSASGCEGDRILFVGRFDAHKGGDVMIDAFARIAARHPTARLTFIGPDRGCVDGAGKRWSIDAYVTARLSDAGARGRFEWLGPLPHEQIAPHRQRAMVTVVASRYETFGIAAVEAMAAGCPLVSTDAGGLSEIVRDGEDALVARTGDAEDLAGKILRLLEEPDQAARLGGRAQATAERFQPEAIARQSLAFYRRTIEQRASRPSRARSAVAQGG